ncbi:MAG: CotH kinase family protein, partial [Bacteroidota bacterium]
MPYLRKLLQFLPFVSLLLFSLSLSGQSVLINEISATNTLLTDEDEKTNDWFELYNASSQPVDLADWGLSDDREAPAKWALPQISLPPGAYLLVWASGKDRPRLAEPRTLITQGDIFRYHLPDAPFLSNWRDLDFDDAVWSTGPSGFGHGDGDDTTEVPPGTLTVQLRKKFTLTAPEDITDMVLSMDIDDGFVAYLNGQEVARDNIRGSRPNYNTRADHDWEANMYSGRSPKDYELLNFRELLRVGENILAIQVHNANITSNDLTAIPYLTAFYRSASNEGIPTPAVLQLDKRNPHTNFKLSGQGETLYLTNAGGSLVDSLAFPAMPTNTSFGRTATGDYAFFAAPTPEARNDTPPATNSNTPHLRFSSPDGPVPATGIDLIISGSLSGESVRYTLDATEPTVASPLYSGPIHIDTATVVRARIFRDNYLPSPVQSRTFLPGADHDLPVVTMVTEPANYFDAQTGIYVLGEGYNGSSPFFGSNIWQDWERPLHFTLHPENGEPAYRFDGGVKIFGGWSRALAQRSLSVFARSAYGSDAIDYPLFTSRPYDSYQAFVLRNSGNDWLQTMLRDAALTGLLADANLETQAYRPTAAYLNGQYWGIYNLREKVNEHFLAAKFDLDPDEINILEFGGDLIHGSTAGYPEFIQFLRQNEANVLSAQQWRRAIAWRA